MMDKARNKNYRKPYSKSFIRKDSKQTEMTKGGIGYGVE